MHEWVKQQISEMEATIEQNTETIKRLQIHNTELETIKTELGTIK